jgi:pyruvate/2-oxoglutarate dehydrogenase complex dihydrolipoamide dehydrogenase (E3) component
VEVYHGAFTPLEFTVPHRKEEDDGYCKLVCVKSENMRVIGIHYIGPNSGEVM